MTDQLAELPGNRLDQVSYLEEALPRPAELPGNCTVSTGFQLHEPHMVAWTLAIRLSLNHFCSCDPSPILLWVTPINLIGSPSYTLVVSGLWSVVGFLPGANRHLFMSP